MSEQPGCPLNPGSIEEIRPLIKETVHETLLSLGVDYADPLEMQKDFQHLRDWRQSSEAFRKKGVLVVATVIVTGILGLIWMGLKTLK